MGIQQNDLALLTARFGAARFGASRFGFIPCPEDVEGLGADEPGEYIWREVHPPETEWTIVGEDCVCRNLCTLALGAISTNPDPVVVDAPVTISVTLTGVLGLPSGVVKVNWGDGGHDQEEFALLENDQVFAYTHTYNNTGDYTITLTVWDERGCTISQTLDVTVAAPVPPVVASFDWGKDAETNLVSFTDTSTGGVDEWSWDLDEGGVSLLQNPSKLYTLPGGPFTVTLTATNSGTLDSDVATAILAINFDDAGSGSGS